MEERVGEREAREKDGTTQRTHAHTRTHTHTHTRAPTRTHAQTHTRAGSNAQRSTEWHGTAPHGANSPPLKKCHFYRRGQDDSENVILTLHGKHKKMCFIRSMGSTFSTFATPPQRNDHFCFIKISAEVCQKSPNVIPTLHEKQNK